MLPYVMVLMLVSFACGENPAVQVVMNNKGLQYGGQVGAGWIQDMLEVIILPDFSGEINIGIFGALRYTLTGISIAKCDFPVPSVEFYEDAPGFKTSILGLSVALTGAWKTHFGLFRITGSFNTAIFSVDMTSVVKLGKDDGGHLSVSSVSCDAHVGDLEIQLRGRYSWLFQRVVNHYKGYIKKDIENRICPSVEKSIVNLESLLQAMKVSFDVDQYVSLELPLIVVPTVNASSLNLGLKGEFLNRKTHADPPFEAQPFTVTKQPDYMLSVGLSEYTLNSASYAYYSADVFQALINDSMIPPSIPLQLNTSSMGPYIPQLPKMFPGLLMSLLVSAREVPLFSFHSDAVNLDLKGEVKAFAIQPNGTETPLFALNVDSKLSGKMWISNGRLKGSIGMKNLSVSLAMTEVGPFKMDAIQKLVNMGSIVVMGKVNDKLGNGVDLPRLKHVKLVNTVLEVDEGFITISSDAQVFVHDASTNGNGTV